MSSSGLVKVVDDEPLGDTEKLRCCLYLEFSMLSF